MGSIPPLHPVEIMGRLEGIYETRTRFCGILGSRNTVSNLVKNEHSRRWNKGNAIYSVKI
ncbi:hypothetical protein BYT27DRAFT_6895585 [Phlegmacium glaucopus]|nr:hypothetical protein BYT27DRAFT_6895585 [Phlegmacium glaucopus]